MIIKLVLYGLSAFFFKDAAIEVVAALNYGNEVLKYLNTLIIEIVSTDLGSAWDEWLVKHTLKKLNFAKIMLQIGHTDSQVDDAQLLFLEDKKLGIVMDIKWQLIKSTEKQK